MYKNELKISRKPKIPKLGLQNGPIINQLYLFSDLDFLVFRVVEMFLLKKETVTLSFFSGPVPNHNSEQKRRGTILKSQL